MNHTWIIDVVVEFTVIPLPIRVTIRPMSNGCKPVQLSLMTVRVLHNRPNKSFTYFDIRHAIE